MCVLCHSVEADYSLPKSCLLQVRIFWRRHCNFKNNQVNSRIVAKVLWIPAFAGWKVMWSIQNLRGS